MNTHPYLRAFLAGILVPTLILPLMLVAFIVLRLMLQVPFPIERGLVFPMALVPGLWGLVEHVMGVVPIRVLTCRLACTEQFCHC